MAYGKYINRNEPLIPAFSRKGRKNKNEKRRKTERGAQTPVVNMLYLLSNSGGKVKNKITREISQNIAR
jgi:hypothetical protein